jgi:transcription elongation factor GreB
MSRGFVKEEDQEEAPIIPPRAALPPNATNYVTPTGLEQLKNEREELLVERRANDEANESEKRKKNMLIDGKLSLLSGRINSARVIDPKDQPDNEVRFGAHITYKSESDAKSKTIQIVGVDEASVKEGKIGFVAPIIRALTGKKVGEKAKINFAGKEQELEILKIEYQ